MAFNLFMIFFLTLINGVFAMCEIAFVSLNDNKVKARANEGDKKAIKLYGLLSDANRFLSTLQIAITLAGFLNSAFASDAFADIVADQMSLLFPSMSLRVLRPVAMVLITLVLSYISLVFGELVPKKIGMLYSEKVAYSLVGFISGVSTLCKPIVSLLSGSTNLVVKILGIDPDSKQEEVTEEEIKMMIDAGQETGAILESEKTLISNIFEFNNTPILDIMTPRKDMVVVDLKDDLSDILNTLYTSHYSRLPVINESIDDIEGIINIKDLFRASQDGVITMEEIQSLIRKPTYVYEMMECDDLFFDMQKNKLHVAIVIDEYGGTAGLVTMEDLIEEIMGNIFDEYDVKEGEEVIKNKDGSLTVDGGVSLDNVENLIFADLPLSQYDTLSGFLVGLLNHLPSQADVGTVLSYGDYRFKILTVGSRVVDRVFIYKETKADA